MILEGNEFTRHGDAKVNGFPSVVNSVFIMKVITNKVNFFSFSLTKEEIKLYKLFSEHSPKCGQ